VALSAGDAEEGINFWEKQEEKHYTVER
jgi:hypothetical protein